MIYCLLNPLVFVLPSKDNKDNWMFCYNTHLWKEERYIFAIINFQGIFCSFFFLFTLFWYCIFFDMYIYVFCGEWGFRFGALPLGDRLWILVFISTHATSFSWWWILSLSTAIKGCSSEFGLFHFGRALSSQPTPYQVLKIEI